MHVPKAYRLQIDVELRTLHFLKKARSFYLEYVKICRSYITCESVIKYFFFSNFA